MLRIARNHPLLKDNVDELLADTYYELYTAAKARKAQLEYEISQHTHIMRSSLSVADFIEEFLRKYGEKKWVASTYKNNVAMLENYVLHIWARRSCRTSGSRPWTTITTSW